MTGRYIHNLQLTHGVQLGVSDFKGMDESEKIQKRLHGGWSENQFLRRASARSGSAEFSEEHSKW